jgi:ecotin
MKSKLFVGLLVASLPLGVMAAEKDYGMKPYPAPDVDQQRLVFRVPALDNEDDHKIEIIAGKFMEVDCNKILLGGDLEQRTAKGWGFPYFVLGTVGPGASTMMACPPGQEETQAFVPVRGDGFLQRYNSKLPVVVYVPEGIEVRYRIWSAGSEVGRAAPE